MENWIKKLIESDDYLGDVEFMGFKCFLVKQKYDTNGRTALQLIDQEDGGPVAIATTNLPEEELGENELFIKNYSENEGMLDCLVDAGYVEATERTVRSGFVTIPVVKLLKHGNPKRTESGDTTVGAVPGDRKS